MAVKAFEDIEPSGGTAVLEQQKTPVKSFDEIEPSTDEDLAINAAAEEEEIRNRANPDLSWYYNLTPTEAGERAKGVFDTATTLKMSLSDSEQLHTVDSQIPDIDIRQAAKMVVQPGYQPPPELTQGNIVLGAIPQKAPWLLKQIAGGEEEAQAIMKANLFRENPEEAKRQFPNDSTIQYLTDNPEQSFIPSLWNTKLDSQRIEEVNRLAGMTREERKFSNLEKGKVKALEHFGERKDLREYMLFSGVLRFLKSSEFKESVDRLQANQYVEGAPEKIRDQLIVRDKLLLLEEMQDRGMTLPAMVLDAAANMGKYAGEIYLMAGLMGGISGITQLGKIKLAAEMAAMNVGEVATLTIERMTDKGLIGDKGEFIKTEEGQILPKALIKSFAEQTVTYWTEQQGEYIAGVMNKMSKGIISRLPKGIASYIAKSGELTKPFYDMIRKGKLDGMIPEMIEEYIERILKPVLKLDDQYRNKDDAYFTRVAKSLIPDPRELLIQTILFSTLPISGQLYGLTRKGIPPVSEKPPTMPQVAEPPAIPPPLPAPISQAPEARKAVVEALAKPAEQIPAEPTEQQIIPEPVPETLPVIRPEVVPIQEVSVYQIRLSKDIPNFKKAASLSTGIMEGQQLEGKYERLATAPILVWERTNGKLEVITGRHRLELARRTGEKTIPAQIVKESEGFTKAMALTADAESNIRDGQGSIKDYAQYFRNTEITEESARERGLLSRSKGEAGFRIGKSAVDDVYAAFLAGRIPDAKAAAIAKGAPNNDPVQHVALSKVDDMSPDELEGFARLVATIKPSGKQTQGNLFGYDESALIEMEAINKEIVKEQRSIKERILAVKGALKRPDIARQMGLEFSDEASIRQEVERLTQRLDDLNRTSTTPELYREMRQRAGLEEPITERPIDLLGRPILEGGAAGQQLNLGIYVDKVPPTNVPTKIVLQNAVAKALNEDAQKVLDSKRKYKGVKDEKELYEKHFTDNDELFIHPESPYPEMRAAWTIAVQGRGLFGGEVRPGFVLVPVIVEEAVNTAKLTAQNVSELAKNLPKTVSFYTGRAAEVIEKNYGSIPAGKQLASDTREIAFQTASRGSKQLNDFEKVVKDLSSKERVQLGKMGQKRAVYADNKKLQKLNAQLLEIMDRDMTDADAAGYRRLLGDKWHNLRGSGGWNPQVLNDTGKLRMKEAEQEGLGNPHVMAAAEEMVKSGDAKSVEDALGRMLDWNNHSLRGTHGYFESTRIILPESWVELDISKTIPHTIAKNAKMIAAAKIWGIEPQQTEGLIGENVNPYVDNERLDFTKARELLGQIGAKFGKADEETLKKWIRTEFGLSNDIPKFVEDTINLLNRYETQARLGFRITSAVRNLTQGDVNLFTAPLSAHIKANAVVMFRKWSDVAAKLYKEAKRSGAVSGMKEMAELERGAGAEPITPGLALKMFTGAEESNHIRAALIARFSAESHIRDLAKLKEGGILNNILQRVKYLSVNPEGYLERFIKNRTFTNPITEQELTDIWSGKRTLTLDDVDRIMHRASVDTQFIQDFASRSIPWKTNPFLRLGLKFKTFAINQTRLIYQDAIKEAAKGTFAPLLKYLLLSAMAGELWNLTKDFITGGDNALITELINKPEKRNIKDIALGLGNDFVDGAGVGILTDMSYGIGNWVAGPAGQTGKNILEWASNLRHPITATRKLAYKELSVSRDIEGLTARADKMFLNDNNRFFEYKRTRDRAFDWLEGQKHPGFITATGKVVLKMLIGQPKYPAILPYEFAAKQITLGDVQDAADYLADAIKNDPRKMDKIRDSMESSMRNYSPLGHISDKDMPKFLSQFSSEERNNIKKLQSDWIADYKKAINLAEKAAGKKTTGGFSFGAPTM